LRIIIVNAIYYFGLDDDDDDDGDDDDDDDNEVAAVSVAAAADMVIRTLTTTFLLSSLSLPYLSVHCNIQCNQYTIFKIQSRGTAHSNHSISYSAVIERYFTYK
jgi:hypothetical protein